MCISKYLSPKMNSQFSSSCCFGSTQSSTSLDNYYNCYNIHHPQSQKARGQALSYWEMCLCVSKGVNIITAAITLDLNIIIIIIAARWSVIMLRDVSMCTKEISTSKWCRQLQPPFVCRIDRLRPPTFMMSMRWYIFLPDNKWLFGYIDSLKLPHSWDRWWYIFRR